MKMNRQLHLWIGLITSIFILMESVTGLLLSEPWLMGGSSERGHGPIAVEGSVPSVDQGQAATTTTEGSTNTATPPTNNQNFSLERAKGGESGNSLMGIVRGLHEGKLGGTNLKIIVDITAVGMITLTVTGITLSTRVLRAQRKSRQRAA